MTEPDVVGALTAEAARKSDTVWVEVPGAVPRALWQVWHAEAVVLVTGGLEQPDPGLVDGAVVGLVLKSKDKGARLLSVEATARRLEPDAPDWPEHAAALLGKRLNSPDGDGAVDRWRTDSQVWRLEPTGRVLEEPGSMSDDDHRREVPDTPATTRVPRPFHLGRATHARR